VFSDTERGEIERERKRKQTLLLRAEVEASRANAEAAQLRLELNELEEKQFAREREEIDATEELERLERAAGLHTPEAVNRTADPILDPGSRADFGWSQDDFTSFVDPSFLAASFAFLPSDFEIGGSFGDSRSPGIELPVSSGA
jgi:hypothetical protein